jgi:hypothetical protein
VTAIDIVPAIAIVVVSVIDIPTPVTIKEPLHDH